MTSALRLDLQQSTESPINKEVEIGFDTDYYMRGNIRDLITIPVPRLRKTTANPDKLLGEIRRI